MLSGTVKIPAAWVLQYSGYRMLRSEAAVRRLLHFLPAMQSLILLFLPGLMYCCPLLSARKQILPFPPERMQILQPLLPGLMCYCPLLSARKPSPCRHPEAAAQMQSP